MQILALRIGDDLLEVEHNLLNSKDTVYLNGREVAKKRRYISATHLFTAYAQDGFTVDHYQVRISIGLNGITHEVYKNKNCLMATSTKKISAPRQRRGPYDRRPRQKRPSSGARPEEEFPLNDEDLLV